MSAVSGILATHLVLNAHLQRQAFKATFLFYSLLLPREPNSYHSESI